jgi:PP-loop superfamily ATP-utilizing enzyme
MTRIPYDEPITAEKMELIGKVEEMVRKNGFKDIRLRLYERRTEGYIGVLEVDEPGRALDVWESIRMDIPGLKMVLDPRGYRQGSLNEGMVPK